MKVAFFFFALFVLANASSLHNFAQKEVKERCPFAGYHSSRYCPTFTSFENEFEETPVEVSSHPALKGLVGIGVDLPSGKIMLPVLSHSYASGKTWKSSNTGTLYSVPDGYIVGSQDIAKDHIGVHLFHHLEDYAKYWSDQWSSSKVSQGGVKVGGLFSHTLSASDLLTKTFIGDHNQAAAVLLNQKRAYHVKLGSSNYAGLALDANFEAAINYLPKAYDASEYALLIEYWGTHVVTEGFFGGNLQQEYVIKECLYSASGNTMDDRTIKEQLDKDFKKYLNPSSPGPNNNLYKHSRKAVVTRVDGGNPEISNRASRIHSFEADPVLTEFAYVPLWEFVKDATKQANVRRAISEHISKVGAAQNNNIKHATDQARRNFLAAKPITVAVNNTFYLARHESRDEFKFVSNIVHLNLAAGQEHRLTSVDLGKRFSKVDVFVRRLPDGRVQALTNENVGYCRRTNAEPVSCGCSVITFDCFLVEYFPIWVTMTIDACIGCELQTYTPTGINHKCKGCQAMTCHCPAF
eukprot:GCRY01000395.1.p1 GENE.GCRY01000395.1~~GCRY01000395.1.p1  ORF type:complete len:522 (-),score=121.73 GCRY01000395.1:425-1990(-)